MDAIDMETMELHLNNYVIVRDTDKYDIESYLEVSHEVSQNTLDN